MSDLSPTPPTTPTTTPATRTPEQVSSDAEPAIETGNGTADAGDRMDFWSSGKGIHALDNPTPFGQENALQKLGRPPFEKSARSKFRLLGYLATVYEHVSQDLRE